MSAPPEMAERLLSSIAQSAPPERPVPAPKPSELRQKEQNAGLRAQWQRDAWSRIIAGWMLLSSCAILAAAGLAWCFVVATPKTKPLAFDGARTLNEAVAAWVQGDRQPDYDALSLYLNAVLPALHTFGPDGALYRPFIKGAISPRIIAAEDSAFSRDQSTIAKRGIHQMLRLQLIDPKDIVFDEASRRLSVTVRGSFQISTKDNARLIEVPYVANVILSPNIPSAVNPFLFYTEDIRKPAVSIAKSQ